MDCWGWLESLGSRNILTLAAIRNTSTLDNTWNVTLGNDTQNLWGNQQGAAKTESIAGNVRAASHSGESDEVYLISEVKVDAVCGGRMRAATPPPPPFLLECLMLTFYPCLQLESWLHNASKQSVFHQPKLRCIPPCVFSSFWPFHFGLVQFGRETL